MRILTISTAISIAIAASLGLLTPNVWIQAAKNLATFSTYLGIDTSLVYEATIVAWETLVMSVFGVSVGTILSYILSPLATPVISSTPISMPIRTLANSIRAIPAIFWAIFFVILVGPGPKAGALALAVYTTGYLTKFFYETLESSDIELVNSLRVMGLKGILLASALYTNMRKQVISNIFFMLEYNIRSAAILGFVGAGGVGYYILQYISLLDYVAVTTYILITILFVIAIDMISYGIRSRI